MILSDKGEISVNLFIQQTFVYCLGEGEVDSSCSPRGGGVEACESAVPGQSWGMRNVGWDGKPQWQPDGVLEKEVELEGLRHCGPYGRGQHDSVWRWCVPWHYLLSYRLSFIHSSILSLRLLTWLFFLFDNKSPKTWALN